MFPDRTWVRLWNDEQMGSRFRGLPSSFTSSLRFSLESDRFDDQSPQRSWWEDDRFEILLDLPDCFSSSLMTKWDLPI